MLTPYTTPYKQNHIYIVYIYASIPSVIQVAQNLKNKYLKSAPKANREKINNAMRIYRYNRKVIRNTAEKVVMALYLPSAFGHVGKRGKPGLSDKIYEDFVSV